GRRISDPPDRRNDRKRTRRPAWPEIPRRMRDTRTQAPRSAGGWEKRLREMRWLTRIHIGRSRRTRRSLRPLPRTPEAAAFCAMARHDHHGRHEAFDESESYRANQSDSGHKGPATVKIDSPNLR